MTSSSRTYQIGKLKLRFEHPQKHSLGLGNGTIRERNGSATYTFMGSPHFTVRIADVTGFSTERDLTSNLFHVYGHGAEIARVKNCAAPGKIEAWFRAHPLFNSNESPTPVTPPSVSVADELRKLAELCAEGVLNDAEFAAQKAKLLAGAQRST